MKCTPPKQLLVVWAPHNICASLQCPKSLCLSNAVVSGPRRTTSTLLLLSREPPLPQCLMGSAVSFFQLTGPVQSARTTPPTILAVHILCVFYWEEGGLNTCCTQLYNKSPLLHFCLCKSLLHCHTKNPFPISTAKWVTPIITIDWYIHRIWEHLLFKNTE